MTTKSRKSPAFQFYPSDFLGSPKVRVMSAEEIGIYLLLLCLEWEQDGFALNEAQEFVATHGVSTECFESAWTRVSRCFVANGRGGFFNPRLEEERRKQNAWRRKCSKGGKMSARRRGKGSSRVVQQQREGLLNTPSPIPTPSPTPKTATTSAARSTWLTPVCVVWEQYKGAGSFRPAKAAGLLKGLKDAGNSPEEIATRLALYLQRLDDPKFASLARFAETFGDHVPLKLTGPPIVDGWFSDEVERLTRPAGLVA